MLDAIADDEGLRPKFSISEYDALSILDGETSSARDGKSRLEWAFLDESSRRFDARTKSRDFVARWRVLGLDKNGVFYRALLDGDAAGKRSAFDLAEPGKTCADVVYPTFKGKRLDFIPPTVANVDRLGIENWQPPPFLDVARVAIANYRLDSLYKLAIWNFASPTLVVKNASEEKDGFALGDALQLNSNSSVFAPDASLLETSGDGLAEIREAKTEIKSALRFTSIRDLLDGAGANSSERALSLRANAGTAALATIDKTGGARSKSNSSSRRYGRARRSKRRRVGLSTRRKRSICRPTSNSRASSR